MARASFNFKGACGVALFAVAALALSRLSLADAPAASPTPRAANAAPAAAAIPSSDAALALSPDEVANDGIAVLSSDGVDAVSVNQGVHDGGTVSALDNATLTQTFVLTNTGTTPVLFDRLEPSCSCTSTIIGQLGKYNVVGDDAGAPGADGLGPSERVPIKMTVNLVGQPDGPLIKRVAVYAKGEALPVAELTIAATVAPTFSFNKNVLEFGTVTAGKPHLEPLNVTVDGRIIGNQGIPKLQSSNPYITLAMGTAFGTVATRTMRPQTTIHYTVTVLPGAPIGPLSARIAYPRPAQGGAKEYAWSSSFVEVTGTVVGDIAADPPKAEFPSIPSGQSASVSLKLAAKSPASLTGVKVTADQPWLEAKIAPDQDARPDTAAQSGVLVLTVDGKAPTGYLQANVLVSCANGENLSVPVMVSVTAAQPTRTPTSTPPTL